MRYSPHALRSCVALALLTLCLAIPPARAGVVIGGTRQIYPAQSREITVQVTNDDKKFPRLVQAWLDSGDEKMTPEQSDVPFTLTPPAFRVEGGKSQSLRMVYTKEPLPADKESVFWLNVLEVPPKLDDGDNQLRFAFRIRTKVFFRPQGLPGTPQDAVATLQWSWHKTAQGSELEVRNPSPYYVSFQDVALALGSQPDARLNRSDQYQMVTPGASQRYLLKDALAALPAGAHVQFSTINDFGGFVPAQAALQPAPQLPPVSP